MEEEMKIVNWKYRPHEPSRWHYTLDGSETICGMTIPYGKPTVISLETSNDLSGVNCGKCIQAHKSREIKAQRTKSDYLVVDDLTEKDIRRIFTKISIDPITGCWNWTGSCNSDGYGRVGYLGKVEETHRLMYAYMVGPVPKGASATIPNLDHIVCNNPKCCNPAHLDLVLPRENTLRGNAPSAINARKVYCIRGHLLPSEPNKHDGNGRECQICRSEYQRKDDRREYLREYHKRKRQETRAEP